MVSSAVALTAPTAVPAGIVRQQSLPTATYASPLTAATVVSSKELPHASLLPLHLCAATLAAAAAQPQQTPPAPSAMPHHVYVHQHSASAPSLPALLLSATGAAQPGQSSYLASPLQHAAAAFSYASSAGPLSCVPLSAAFDLTSSLCRSKQRLARKAELARQSRKRKKSAISHMHDAIRQLRDDNARLRQRLARLGVTDPDSGHGGARATKRTAAHCRHHDRRRAKRDEGTESERAQAEDEDEEDINVSELTDSSGDESSDGSGVAELGALSPSSTPSSVASSLLSAASSLDLPLTALRGKRGRT